MAPRGQPVYPLNIAAQLVGLSPRTLRLYEEAGLIRPARVGGNEQRLYSDQDLQWLRCIRDMIHEEGLTVTAIRRLLDLIPCWEIRHCEASVALSCAPYQNVPGMARAATAHSEASRAVQTPQGDGSIGHAPVQIKLIYGVEELGAVLPCMRCIMAERTARKVAQRFPGQVTVVKYDLLSPQAAPYGPLLVPTVIVDEEVVATGKGVSEERLARAVENHLSRAGHLN